MIPIRDYTSIYLYINNYRIVDVKEDRWSRVTDMLFPDKYG